MLTLQGISYFHPNQDGLFHDLSLTLHRHDTVALVGNNGSGKSTLLRIIAGELAPASGQRIVESPPYLVPQVFGQFDHLTVAQALGADPKLHALQQILAGDTGAAHFVALQDDWTIEDRCHDALRQWQLEEQDLHRPLATMSGGQSTRVFLAGITLHQPDLVLMDEPSNHLDQAGRDLLYDWIRNTRASLLVVSHDRTLLNLVDTVCELDRGRITVYGGNYAFFREQKDREQQALHERVQHQQKELRKAKARERDTLERQNRRNARGHKQHEQRGTPKVMMDKMKNDAENSSARLKEVHAEKIDGIREELQDLRANVSGIDQMALGLEGSGLHRGKVLFRAEKANVAYGNAPLWQSPLRMEIRSGERIALAGHNGSGKTTLIRLILGQLQPTSGEVFRPEMQTLYLDQDYSLIDNRMTVYEQAHRFSEGHLPEHEINIRLARMLFPREVWDKPCAALSGGERMRLSLVCLGLTRQPPDLLLLDEPTNNLDLLNMEILTAAIGQFPGTLLVVSHDAVFVEELGITRRIELAELAGSGNSDLLIP